MSGDFLRYLAAKRTVDDRALNRSVLQALRERLPVGRSADRLTVLELGAGIGTMIERLVEWSLLSQADITAIDAAADCMAEAGRRLPIWAAGQRLAVSRSVMDGFDLADSTHWLTIRLATTELYDFAQRQAGQPGWQLVIANAVLDLLDLARAVPAIVGLTAPGGLLYLTINFDGGTIFQPTIDRAFDALVEARYHLTMDRRLTAGRPSGDSYTGRRLLVELPAAGGQLLAAGSSDWVVFPQAGGYPADEAYFLRSIIATVYRALRDDMALDQTRLAAWIARRQGQIERGELIYIAHQLDLLARRDARP